MDDVIARLQSEGPIDLALNEDEYEILRARMRRHWNRYSWKISEQAEVLSFFRGYTFYRELSEKENTFWVAFFDELGVRGAGIAPSPRQYDLLWQAFGSHPLVKAHMQRDGRGRAFVRTIDETWGIRSLQARHLVNAFVRYYEEHPGEVITVGLMRRIIEDVDEAQLRQVASFDRVFRSMVIAVDIILADGLESLSVEGLISTLESRGVDLGQPNALRYFTNKNSHAVAEIVGRLRRQRTSEQFRALLATLPHHQFKTPRGQILTGLQLGSMQLDYGRYVDRTNEQEHVVTPDARISMQILERLPLDEFDQAAGVALFLSARPFDAVVGDKPERSVPFIGRRGERHLWAGVPRAGRGLVVAGRSHPGSIGVAGSARTQLRLNRDGIEAYAELTIDTFLPCRTERLMLRSAGATHVLEPCRADQRFSFPLPPDGELTAYLEAPEPCCWTWDSVDRLFTASGTEIGKTRHHLLYGPRQLYLLSRDRPRLSEGATAERLPGPAACWRVIWDGAGPLEVNRWTIDRAYPTWKLERRERPKANRQDVTLYLHPGYHGHDETVHIPVQDGWHGASLHCGQQVFEIEGSGFRVRGLPPGLHRGEVFIRGEVVADLEPLRVLPPLAWTLARETTLVHGRIQGARVAREDGRFEVFRWKPRADASGRPLRSSHRVTFDDGVDVEFDLEANCVSGCFLQPGPMGPISVLRMLHPDAVVLSIRQPHTRQLKTRVLVASMPQVRLSAEDLYDLRPAARDTIHVEVCLDARSDHWVPLTQVPVHLKPVINRFEVRDGMCHMRVTGPSDLSIRMEVWEPGSGSSEAYDAVVRDAGVVQEKVRFRDMFVPLRVRALVSTYSDPEEVVIVEAPCAPIFDRASLIRRGVGWSKRSESPMVGG